MAQNPVINKFGAASGGGRGGAPSPADLQRMYDRPAYLGPTAGSPAIPTEYMTLDDVVVRTGAMLAVLLLAGAASWVLVPDSAAVGALFVGALAGVAIGLYMSFTMRANAATALLYSAFQGVALGAISHLFNNAYPGIVVQAVIGTIMVAAAMLFVYRIGAIRVTPKFTRVVVGATIGVFGLMLINLIAYLFTADGLGLRSGGPIAIVFSLICIVVASMNLVMDFDVIERGIRQGADRKFAWYAAFGLMVTLVWLYIEILRLLGYARGK
jgi:uncharacterized YccA/Bax inhibitor family protein